MELLKNDLPAFLSVKSIRTVYSLQMQGKPPKGDVHDFPEIIYVSHGANPVLIDGERIELSEGQMAIYAPGAYHIGEAPTYAGLEIITFDCDSTALASLYNRTISLNRRQRTVLTDIVNDALSLFVRVPKESGMKGMRKRDDVSDYELHKLKNQLELFLIDLYHSERSEGNRKKELFDEICAHLRSHVCDRLTLEEVAEHAHIGVSTLTALFREYASCGVITYYNDLKIEEAKRLIRESKMNFTEVAETLGFSSIHYFSKLFKKVTGKTPSEYAKKKRNTH